ncbi:MAG: GTPase, partial [Bradymonadaceae bacterium]
MIVAIIGRPNTGKSRLFNRLTSESDAIVHDEPGVTRDRRYGRARIGGESSIVVDTGGLVPGSEQTLEARMRRQAEAALSEADAVVMLLDGREGLVPADREIVEELRDADRPVFFAVNKADDPERTHEFLADFYELGVDLHPISAEHDIGVDDLLEDISERAGGRAEGLEEPDYPRLAVVGRPNVGKSTLINAAVGGERVLTDDEPGTTRDTVDTYLEREAQLTRLVWFAGMDVRLGDRALASLMAVVDRGVEDVHARPERDPNRLAVRVVDLVGR